MSELRWSLLILGALFLVALLSFEWWRSRRRERAAREARFVTGAASAVSELAASHERELTPASPEVAAREIPNREPAPWAAELPQIDPREPALGELPIIEMDTAPVASAAETTVSAASLVETSMRADRADADTGAALADTVTLVEWPPEAERRIIGLRLVPKAGVRFSGLRLRQALVGDGYAHGEFGIFHRPGADGRVVVSAASLTKPGFFELARMDTQTFAGLNLFIVLPGSQPPLLALEALVVSARALAQRLGGELRTAANEALGDAEVQQLRQSLRDPDAAVLRTAGAA